MRWEGAYISVMFKTLSFALALALLSQGAAAAPARVALTPVAPVAPTPAAPVAPTQVAPIAFSGVAYAGCPMGQAVYGLSGGEIPYSLTIRPTAQNSATEFDVRLAS